MNSINEIYLRYGFTCEPPRGQLSFYTRQSGYLYAVEIVAPSPSNPTTDEVQQAERIWQEAGYACKLRIGKTAQEIEAALFDGFFQLDRTRRRLKQGYDEYCARQSTAVGTDYSYVDCPYVRVAGQPQGRVRLIDEAYECLRQDGAALVIIEAAAGFGKTCTSYELLQRFIADPVPLNPILAEMQHDRHARVFRHVLLAEINRQYSASGLSAEAVEHEIRIGRIPLIVDGFDELLHEDREARPDPRQLDVEPMLRTLADRLLSHDAKVVMTTRRTAVIGEAFDKWLQNLNIPSLHVHRFVLREPEVEHWLGAARARALMAADIPIQSLSNPVLLAYLRSLHNRDFARVTTTASSLVKRYFNSMFNRERQRQELPLSSNDQRSVLRKVAAQMLIAGTSVQPRETIRSTILGQAGEILARAARAATTSSNVVVEKLADKLTDHALFDRKLLPGGHVGIGFVNDFVYGIIAGEAMLELPSEVWFSEIEMDKAVTAHQFQPSATREALWHRLHSLALAMDEQWQVQFDMRLLGRLNREINDGFIEDLLITDTDFSGNTIMRRTTVRRCTFTRCKFTGACLREVQFLDCKFQSCSVSGGGDAIAWFSSGCIEYDSNILAILRPGHVEGESENCQPVEESSKYERMVLEQFWPTARASPTSMLAMRTLFRGVNIRDRVPVQTAIERLCARGLVSMVGDTATIDFRNLSVIKGILGRAVLRTEEA